MLTRHLLHLRLRFGCKRGLQPQFHRGSLRVHFMAVVKCPDSKPRVWVVGGVSYVDLQQAQVGRNGVWGGVHQWGNVGAAPI